jgi:hypothetical protein
MSFINLTLETLAPSKLLNYVQKDRLREFHLTRRPGTATASTTEQIQYQSEGHEETNTSASIISMSHPSYSLSTKFRKNSCLAASIVPSLSSSDRDL